MAEATSGMRYSNKKRLLSSDFLGSKNKHRQPDGRKNERTNAQTNEQDP